MRTTTQTRAIQRRTEAILTRLDDHLPSAISNTAGVAIRRNASRRLAGRMLAASVLAVATAFVPEPAAAGNSDLYCEGYATDAVRRHRDYARKQCGDLVNLVWNPNYAAHYAYCKRVDLGTAEWVRSMRYSVILNDCAAPKPAVAR